MIYIQKLQFLNVHSLHFIIGLTAGFLILFTGTFILFHFAVISKWHKLSLKQRLLLIFCTGICAFYLTVWLPKIKDGLYQEHVLKIKPVTDGENFHFTLTWFKTQFKEISFSEFTQEGKWKMDSEGLSTEDSQAVLSWKGKTGDIVTLEFFGGPNEGTIQIDWDGHLSKVELYHEKEQKYSYDFVQAPPVRLPFYIAFFILLWMILIAVTEICLIPERRNSLQTFILVSACVFIIFRIFQFISSGSEWITVDTQAYIGLSKYSIRDILLGRKYCYKENYCLNRPVLIPLYYKFFSGNIPMVSKANLVISILSWLYLVYASGKCLRLDRMKKISAVILLGLGCCPNITRWDKMALSESLTISLIIQMIAGWLLLMKDSDWKIKNMVIFGLTTILTIFSRDSSLWTTAISTILLAILLFKKENRHKNIILCSVIVLFSLLNLLTVGNRWLYSFYNTFSIRILNDPQAVEFFKDNGMPNPPDLPQIKGIEHLQANDLFMSEEFKPLRNWIDSNAKRVYAKWCLNSVYGIIQDSWYSLFEHETFEQNDYRFKPIGFSSLMPDTISKFLMLNIPGIFYILIGIVSGCLAVDNKQREWYFPISLILFSFILGILVYLSDAYDMERHLIVVSIPMKISGWLAIFYLLDNLQIKIPARQNEK